MRALSIIALLPLLVAASLVGGCSSVNSMFGGNSKKQALEALKWTYAKDAITLHLNADPQLNNDDGQAHTLLLAVLQMESPNAFTAATASASQVSALLVSGGVPKGFLAVDRVFASPGQQCSISLARVEKAQYVGVVAGYYTLDPKRVARLYRIGVEIETSGIVAKKRTAKPQPLVIDLKLGSSGIVGDDQKPAKPPKPPPQPKAGQVDLSKDASSGGQTCSSAAATAMGEARHNAT